MFKNRSIRLVNNDKRRNCLLSEPNYYSTKWFPKYVEMVFDISIVEDTEKPLIMGKNKKITGFMKDELGEEITKEFSRLKMYSNIKIIINLIKRL